FADEDLRHRGAAGPGDHPLALGRVEVDPHLGPFQALAAEEVLRRDAIGADGAGVHRDRGGSLVVQVGSPGTRGGWDAPIRRAPQAMSTRTSVAPARLRAN